MSRRYFQPVRVRTDESDAPTQFLWRGRSYSVRAVLGHWIEGGTWWRRLQRGASAEPDRGAGGGSSRGSGDRQVWRVEASVGGSPSVGVYDLCRDSAAIPSPDGPSHRWHLARALD